VSKPVKPHSRFTEVLRAQLAVHLRTLRVEGQWTLNSLAKQCRMSTKTIRQLEQPLERIPSLKTLDKIASALNVETSSLFGEVVSSRSRTQNTVEQVLAERLVEERKRLKWSQELLSETSGLGREHIAHIERGRQNPSLDTLVLLACALDTTVESLLSTRRAL
jgi:transcriptional regulator with XRE-family HTH domain